MSPLPASERIAALRAWRPAVAVFAAVAALLTWFYGNLIVFSSDEGIILDAAERMLHGSRLYMDFFGYMTPGSYWLHELAMGLFGVTLRAGRAVLILDCALQCALLWWLASILVSRAAAWFLTALYFLLLISQPSLLTPQHRWDSAAISLASIVACLLGYWTGRRAWWAAAGALAALAVSCTPSIALIVLATVLWLSLRPLRRFFWSYAAGGVCAGAAMLVLAWSTGILHGALDQMRWLHSHYTSVNSMPYGSIIGGYAGVSHALAGFPWVLRVGLVFCLALPAILPVAGVVGCGAAVILRRMRRCSTSDDLVLGYLALCVIALVATTYPRADVAHLAFVVPLAYVLAAKALWRPLHPVAMGALLFLFICAFALAVPAVGLRLHATRLESPVGTIYADAGDKVDLQELFAKVHPGDRLYVHPYLPVAYFLTQSRNPTPYSYLAPGMMAKHEELETLADLQRNPPDWVLYLELSRAEFLRVFPNATRLDPRFHLLEGWIKSNYEPVNPPIHAGGYQLWSRKPPAQASAGPHTAKSLLRYNSIVPGGGFHLSLLR